MKFPFNEPENTAVITCSHILCDGHTILYVFHDADDGMWQFLCGGTHTEHQAKVVSLEEIFEADNSISQLANMPCGYVAMRRSAKEKWVIKKR